MSQKEIDTSLAESETGSVQLVVQEFRDVELIKSTSSDIINNKDSELSKETDSPKETSNDTNNDTTIVDDKELLVDLSTEEDYQYSIFGSTKSKFEGTIKPLVNTEDLDIGQVHNLDEEFIYTYDDAVEHVDQPETVFVGNPVVVLPADTVEHVDHPETISLDNPMAVVTPDTVQQQHMWAKWNQGDIVKKYWLEKVNLIKKQTQYFENLEKRTQEKHNAEELRAQEKHNAEKS